MLYAKHHAVRLECGMPLDLAGYLKLATAVYSADQCLAYTLHMRHDRQQIPCCRISSAAVFQDFPRQ